MGDDTIVTGSSHISFNPRHIRAEVYMTMNGEKGSLGTNAVRTPIRVDLHAVCRCPWCLCKRCSGFLRVMELDEWERLTSRMGTIEFTIIKSLVSILIWLQHSIKASHLDAKILAILNTTLDITLLMMDAICDTLLGMHATPQLWVLHMKRLRESQQLLQKVDDGNVAIGWKGIDLTKMKDREQIKKGLKGYLDDESIPMTAGQLFRFGYEAKKGEYVVLPVSGSTIVKIGVFADNEVRRDNSFDDAYVHVRKVEWLKDVQRTDFSQQVRNTLGSFTSFCTGGDHVTEEVQMLLKGSKITKRSSADIEDVDDERMEFALEKYLEEFLIENWSKIEFGEELTIYTDKEGNLGNQYPAGDAGNIDILAQDAKGNFVVIELKKGRKTDAVVGQILRYMAWVRKNLAKKGQSVRGVVIVGEKDAYLDYALSEVADKVSLKIYRIQFSLLE